MLTSDCNPDLLPESNKISSAKTKAPTKTDWKTSIASELHRVKKKEKEVEGFSNSEINDIFLHICTE